MRLVVREFLTPFGRNPFREWLDGLEVATGARIQARIFRFELGNLGDHKFVGRGVWEARFQFGPGYRLYFGKVGRNLVLLLCGGDKDTQRRDIGRAQEYWAGFLEVDRDG